MYIFQDFKTYHMSKAEKIFRLFFDRGISAVFIYRLSRWCYIHKLTVLAILLKQFNIFLNNCEIAYQANIGKGFRIFHAFGIVIANSDIGENFTIFQNVTIGKTENKPIGVKHVPTIGNNVVCYAGSVIAGPITIGDRVKVGANAVVLKDIPNDTTAIGGKTTYINKVRKS